MGMFGVGSFKPLTFISNGKPVNPAPPAGIDRTPSRNGIMFTGSSSTREFQQKVRAKNSMTPQELGSNAVKISKSLGISVNITI